MRIVNISERYRIISHYMAQLRDINKQKNRMVFRSIISDLGRLLAVEAANFMRYQLEDINTPFSSTRINVLLEDPILFAIARAGIQLQDGVESIFYNSASGLCTCKKDSNGIRQAILFPPCGTAGKIVIISDPIMTSGSSMVKTINAIKSNGIPSRFFILNIISTNLSIDNLSKELPDDMVLITCAIDDYTKGVRGTLPGLGDVGDLLYGLQ